MPIITFWSNNEKAIGQTVSVACIATNMAIEHNYKVLLISADFNNDSIENCFGTQETNKSVIKGLINTPQITLDTGISGLLKLADSGRVTPENIHDYTKIIFKNSLEILYSPSNIADEKQQAQLMEKFKNIILNASKYYDQVFVDLKKGLRCSGQLDILEMSDVIVVNIEQGTKTIKNFLQTNETKKFVQKNMVIWNICKYDKKSKYNIKNLSRTILKKQPVYALNYNTLVMEASQEGKIVELLIKLKTVKGDEESTEFLDNIRDTLEGIILKYNETQRRI